MIARMIKAVLVVWEREMYEYLSNLHINALRLAVEPLLFIFIFGMERPLKSFLAIYLQE
jgi:hypothetical protein